MTRLWVKLCPLFRCLPDCPLEYLTQPSHPSSPHCVSLTIDNHPQLFTTALLLSSVRPKLLPVIISITMSRFRSQRKKNARSIASEDRWRVDNPFGPPRMASFPGGGIQRIRNTLSRLSPSARAERQLLKQKSQYKVPLTERNIDTLVTNQLFSDSFKPERRTELQISAWLERLAY